MSRDPKALRDRRIGFGLFLASSAFMLFVLDWLRFVLMVRINGGG